MQCTWGREVMLTKFWLERLKGTDHLEGRWKNIKMDLRKIWFGGVDWIYLAQDRD
jgi:hypothetical protein